MHWQNKTDGLWPQSITCEFGDFGPLHNERGLCVDAFHNGYSGPTSCLSKSELTSSVFVISSSRIEFSQTAGTTLKFKRIESGLEFGWLPSFLCVWHVTCWMSCYAISTPRNFHCPRWNCFEYPIRRCFVWTAHDFFRLKSQGRKTNTVSDIS